MELDSASYTTPLFQILSVSIHDVSSEDKPCEIYGRIQVSDSSGFTWELYCRDRQNAEIVRSSEILRIESFDSEIGSDLKLKNEEIGPHTISLVGPATVLYPYGSITMDVELKDRSRDDGLVSKGLLGLHFNQEMQGKNERRSYPHVAVTVDGRVPAPEEETRRLEMAHAVISSEVKGDIGSAIVHHVTFLRALIVNLEAGISTESSAVFGSKHRRIRPFFGQITATYGGDLGIGDPRCAEDLVYHRMQLFNGEINRPLSFRGQDHPLDLDRAIFAVPISSSLILEAKISYDGEPVLAGRVEFRPRQLPLVQGVCALVFTLNLTARFETCVPPFKMLKEPAAVEARHRSIFQPKSRRFQSLLEVFSANVWCDQHSSCRISGTIITKKGDDAFSVFRSSCHSPATSNRYFPLKLIGPSLAVDCLDYFIYFSKYNLPGPLKFEWAIRCSCTETILSEGQFGLCYGPLGYDDGERMCLVHRGKVGHVAVCFSLFKSALQAKLQVRIFLRGAAAFNQAFTVHGKVKASYSNYQYPTDYEREWFQIALFDEPYRPHEGSQSGVPLKPEDIGASSGFSLPLCRSIVVVPKGSALVLNLQLEFFALTEIDPVEIVSELIEFADEGNCNIEGELFRIEAIANSV